MKHFFQMAEGLDVTPLALELTRRADLWNKYPVRTFHERSAHRTVDDVVLRYNRFDAGDDYVDMVCSRLEVENYPPLAELAGARQLIAWLMARVSGEHLGRVFISRIRPGAGIPPHTDRIAPAEEAFPDRIPPASYYDRYHVCLQSAPGVIFRCGNEKVYMAPGSAWWFDNEIEHEVANHSAIDRLHLVADIHTYRNNYVPTPHSVGRKQ